MKYNSMLRNFFTSLNPTWLSCFLILGAIGCDAFFEEDISGDNVIMIVPLNGSETDVVTQTFMWEGLDGVDSFKVQIVAPDFANAATLIADTFVTGTQFVKTLYPGQFEWRIRGENTAYQTGWSYAKFTIFSTDDLSKQQIQILLPNENSYTNKVQVSFSWATLYNAANYRFMAYSGGWGNSLVLDSSKITNGKLSVDMPEGTITWGVKAYNDVSESAYVTHQLIVDRTNPVKPSLKTPTNKASLSDTTVVFSWISSDAVSSVSDSLCIYSDSGLANLTKVVIGDGKEASVGLYAGKTYYWRVRSKDKAGNLSSYSTVNEFTIRSK